MSDLHARLNTLANRGTPRGADAVIEAAARNASLGVIDGERVDDDEDVHEMHDADGIPFVSAEPIRHRRPRRRFSSMVAAAGMAAMLLVGTLAISALVGNGGANSPEGAVRRLADAVHHGDPLAAADVMAPSEVRSLAGTVRTAEKKAASMQLVHTASEPLSGVDLSVADLQLTVQPLADGYAKVVVNDGTLHASTKKAKFSALMQKVLRDSSDNKADIDLSQLAGDSGLGSFVVAVRQDGHWYVSAAYTVLEYVREYNHVQAQAHFGSGVQAMKTLGADTPDAAIKNSINALAHNDWDTLLAMAPPDEIPVYDYRDVLKELINTNDAKTDFTVDSISTTPTMHGDTASVVVKASGKSNGQPWSLDGGCFTPPPDGSGNLPSTCVNGAMNPLRLLYALNGVYNGGSSMTAPNQGITTVQRDGRWFVSPMGSILDVVDNWINTLDRRHLYLMLGIADQLPPDGTITLGQSFVVKHNVDDATILTLHGTKGQKLLGFQEFTAPKPKNVPDGAVYTYVRVYGPNDAELPEAQGMFWGSAFELPADGSYSFVFTNAGAGDANVTIWNEKDAPAKARTGPDGSTCTFDTSNSSTCFSSTSGPLDGTSGVTPLPLPPGQVPPNYDTPTTVLANTGG